MVTTAAKLQQIRSADPRMYRALKLLIEAMLPDEKDSDRPPASQKRRRK